MRKAITLLLFSILVITGCGAQTSETTETEPDTSETTETEPDGGAVVPTTDAPIQDDPTQPEPEPTVEDALVSGDVLLQSDDGYEFEALFQLSLGTPRSEVRNAPPGETDMFVPVEGTVTLVNPSVDRDIPGLEYAGDFWIAGIWPVQSSICQGNGYTSLAEPAGDYCGFRLVHGAVAGPSIQAGASATTATTEWFPEELEWRIPEENFEVVSAELFEPTAWFFGKNGEYGDIVTQDNSSEAELCVYVDSAPNNQIFWSSVEVQCAEG